MRAVAGSRSRAERTISVRPAAVVGHLAQCQFVHAFFVGQATLPRQGQRGPGGHRRQRRAARHAPPDTARHGPGEAKLDGRERGRTGDGAAPRTGPPRVDPDGVDEHLGLADDLPLDLGDARVAACVVAVRDHHRAPSCGAGRPAPAASTRPPCRRVPSRRSADVARAAAAVRSRGPSLDEHRLVAESIEEDFILRAEQVEEESAERSCAARILSPAIDPDVSSAMPRLTGTRSLLKYETGCATPSS